VTTSNTRLLLTTYLEPVQALDDAIAQVAAAWSIEDGTGDVLDKIGTVVGQARNGLADDPFRCYLRAKIAANRSDTTAARVLAVVRAALGPARTDVTIRAEETAILSCYLHLEDAVVSDDVAAAIADLVDLARGVGFRFLLHYLPVHGPAATFAFARSAHLTAGVGIGVTTLAVDSTAGFPATGNLHVDVGTADEEQLTYVVAGPTEFTINATTKAHGIRAACTTQNSDRGFGGGHLSALVLA